MLPHALKPDAFRHLKRQRQLHAYCFVIVCYAGASCNVQDETPLKMYEWVGKEGQGLRSGGAAMMFI